MRHLSGLIVKERLYNKTFYIITFIGMAVTLMLLVNGDMSFNGESLDDFKSRAEIVLVICNFFACLFAILLSSGTLPKDRETKRAHLILVRGIKKWEYGLSMTIGNIIISILCFALLSSTLYIGAVILGDHSSLILIAKSQLILVLNVIVLSSLVSFFSIYLPGSVASFLGIIFYFMGVFYDTLKVLVSSLDNIFSEFIKLLLYLVPNISALQKQAGSMFSDSVVDISAILSILLYGYVTIMLIVLLYKREV